MESAHLAVELGELGGQAETRLGANFCLAQKLLARGDAAGAELEMVKGDEVARHPSNSPMSRAVHFASRVMFAILQDDLESALRWGNRLSEFSNDALGVWLRHVPARLLIAQGKKTEAAQRTRRFVPKSFSG